MMAFQEMRQYHEGFMVWHAAYTNMSFLAHWHKEAELILVRSGTASITVGSRTYSVQKGDLILCGSECIHYSDSFGMENILEFILFDLSLVQNPSLPITFPCPVLTCAQQKEAGLFSTVQHLFRHLPEELNHQPPYYQEVVKGMLREFWYKAQRALFAESAPFRPLRDTQPIQEILQYMELHCNEELALPEASGMAHMSECYFSRCFKRYTGLNYITYRNLLRVERAVSFLQDSSLSVSEIAFECGFQNLRTFNRVFRQYTAHTPSEFRRKNLAENYVVSFPRHGGSQPLMVENDSPVVKTNQVKLAEYTPSDNAWKAPQP